MRTKWIAPILAGLLLSFAASAPAQSDAPQAAPAADADAATAEAPSIYALEVKPMAIDKETTNSLKPYEGKVMLIVNVASRCGFTPQYEGLETLYREYKDQGLVVLGFPCNQFGGQEPGTELEIMEFCESNYDVTFPLYAKLDVNGDNRAPLYKLLTGPTSPEPGDVRWNFEKFLVGRDGKIIARYRSAVTPQSEELVGAVKKALAEKPAETAAEATTQSPAES